MAAGTLYTYPDNFRAWKILIAAQYSKADVKVAPNFVFGETNKSKDFLQKFPGGKVPAFEGKNGELVQDSNAIAYYVANDELNGKDKLTRAKILQWMNFGDAEILPPACTWLFPILGILKANPEPSETIREAKNDLKAALITLNNHLLTRTYLVGERITLADIVLACNLLNPYKYILDPEYRKPFANVNRWFVTLINQPQFKAVIGEVTLCDKVAQIGSTIPSGDAALVKEEFRNPDYMNKINKENKQKEGEISNESSEKEKTETSCEKPTKKKGKKKKEEKKQEKKEKPKKETPKKEEPEELDAAEAALAAEPKSKDPFESMPKGTFNMDDFKRVYSNEEVSVSVPYFWEKFDPENYSIWFCEYKYPEELSKVFMSCNLITGMFQRLDKMRKHAFGCVCLYGEDNNSTISGIWVWRGQELAFTLSPDWQIDYESYTWKKLDPTSDSTKNLINNYLKWEGSDSKGRKFNQGKIFK